MEIRVDDVSVLKEALVRLIHAGVRVIGEHGESESESLHLLEQEIDLSKNAIYNTRKRERRRKGEMGQQAQVEI